MSKGWDNATLKKLKALTGKGLSTSEIGKRLGLSKNAIVGKLNRMGWNSKATAEAAAKAASGTTTSAKKTTKTATPKKATAAKTPKKTTVVATKKTTTPKKAAATKAAPKKVVTPKAEKKSAPAKPKTSEKTKTKTLAMHQRIIQHSLEMASLKPNQCRWPIGDPDSENFHFCGETVFVGKPYCYEHCKQAYQFTPPKKK